MSLLAVHCSLIHQPNVVFTEGDAFRKEKT